MELLQFDRFAGDPIRVVLDDQYIDQFGDPQIRLTARLTAKGVRDLHHRLGGGQLPAPVALVAGGLL